MELRRSRWRIWCATPANERVFSAVLTAGAAGTLVKLAGMLKLVVVARYFGIGDPLDAYLIAFLLPSFFAEVIGGSFHAALIPAFVAVRERRGTAAAQSLLSSIVGVSTALLTAMGLLTALSIDGLLPILGSGFSAENFVLTRRLFFLLLPVLILSGVSTIGRAILSAVDRIGLAAGAPCATPLVTIALLIMAGRTWGPYALAAGAAAGSATELGLVAWGLHRQGLSLLPCRPVTDPVLHEVLRQYAPVVVGALCMAGAAVVDQAMAATLGTGSVSALNYGNKLVTVFLAIGSGALSTAVLPQYSRLAALANWNELRSMLASCARLVLAIALPVTLVLLAASEPLVAFFFQRGAFTEADTAVVASVQRFALLQLPFALLATLMARLISSLRANRLLLWGAALYLAAATCLDLLFMRWLGVAGIALATTTVSFVYLCYLSAVVLRLWKRR